MLSSGKKIKVQRVHAQPGWRLRKMIAALFCILPMIGNVSAGPDLSYWYSTSYSGYRYYRQRGGHGFAESCVFHLSDVYSTQNTTQICVTATINSGETLDASSATYYSLISRTRVRYVGYECETSGDHNTFTFSSFGYNWNDGDIRGMVDTIHTSPYSSHTFSAGAPQWI